MQRIDLAILRTIEEFGCIGATRISAALMISQLEVPPRTVRFRLRQLDRAGLTVLRGRRQGRALTEEGRKALVEQPETVSPCVTTRSRVNDLLYRWFQRDPEQFVVLDVVHIPSDHLSRALVEVHSALSAGLGIANRLAFVDSGKSTEWLTAPEDAAVLGVIGAVTLDGLLVRLGVTVVSSGAGIMQIRDRRPFAFKEWIGTASTCSDVPALFVAAGMTRVRDVIRTGSGRVVMEFREVPSSAYTQVTRLAAEWRKKGRGHIVAVGRPGESLCGLPVGAEHCGILAASGANILAAIRETGIEAAISTGAALHPRDGLAMIETIRGQKWQRATASYPA